MKRYLGLVSFALVCWLAPGAPTIAFAQGPYRVEHLLLPPLEAKGCYYYRQHRYCGRYCYYEANGMRYCQPRAREAFPQAPVVELDDAPPPPRRHKRHSLK